jgi:hypothetical protein
MFLPDLEPAGSATEFFKPGSRIQGSKKHNDMINVSKAGLRIRINFIRIRIRIQLQLFRLNTDPDSIRIQGFNDKKFTKKN